MLLMRIAIPKKRTKKRTPKVTRQTHQNLVSIQVHVFKNCSISPRATLLIQSSFTKRAKKGRPVILIPYLPTFLPTISLKCIHALFPPSARLWLQVSGEARQMIFYPFLHSHHHPRGMMTKRKICSYLRIETPRSPRSLKKIMIRKTSLELPPPRQPIFPASNSAASCR